MNSKGSIVAVLLAALLLAVGAVRGAGSSGDEILARVEEEGEFLGQGSLITTLRLENSYPDGTSSGLVLGGLGKRAEGGEYALYYILEPEGSRGSIFLSQERAGEKSRMWIYLPLLGRPVEFVSEEEQEESFFGSAFSNQDIASREMTDEYTAEVTAEETLEVGERTRPVYVLSLVAKPGTDVHDPTATVWVDREAFIVLRAEYRNAQGDVERGLEVLALGEFEGRLTPDRLVVRDVVGKRATTVAFLERQRPAADFPDALFAPENLPTFDPTVYGLSGD